jgi:calcium/calmodulin-dependent protein kinase I
MAVAYRPTQIAGYTYGSGPIPYRRIDWRKKTKQLQDFISLLLEFDPQKRPSAEEALSHEWFSIESKE